PARRDRARPERRGTPVSDKPALSERARAERKLGWMLSAPAVTVMLLVTAYPIVYAIWLSLQRYDLRFPDDRELVGLSNYRAVLTNEAFWQDLTSTLIITGIPLAIERVPGPTLSC